MTDTPTRIGTILLPALLVAVSVHAGPYSAGDDTAHAVDPAIAMGDPAFLGWATGWQDYHRADGETNFSDPSLALGPPAGNALDVVSLGDLTAEQIAASALPGSITLTFDTTIANGEGVDFAVFENGFINGYCEFAYVEVSTDGSHFARFDNSVFAGATAPVGGYGPVDETEVFNLAGKHRQGFGTPFDLDDLAGDPLVTEGTVDLEAINYVRLVDIPGSGDFTDGTGQPIYDAWVTWGSGGFDLDAVGVLNEAGAGGPLAVSGPVNTAVYEDAPRAAFTVWPTGGVPPYQYNWQKNGASLAIQPMGPVLEIPNPATGDEGLYRCVVTDSGGPPSQVPSTGASLSVLPHARIDASPQSATVSVGENVTLEVAASGGIGTLHYQWRFDQGAKVLRNVGGDSPTLVLNPVDGLDAGRYWVEVSDDFEKVASTQAELDVLGAQVPALSSWGAVLLAAAVGGVGVCRRGRMGP